MISPGGSEKGEGYLFFFFKQEMPSVWTTVVSFYLFIIYLSIRALFSTSLLAGRTMMSELDYQAFKISKCEFTFFITHDNRH